MTAKRHFFSVEETDAEAFLPNPLVAEKFSLAHDKFGSKRHLTEQHYRRVMFGHAQELFPHRLKW